MKYSFIKVVSRLAFAVMIGMASSAIYYQSVIKEHLHTIAELQLKVENNAAQSLGAPYEEASSSGAAPTTIEEENAYLKLQVARMAILLNQGESAAKQVADASEVMPLDHQGNAARQIAQSPEFIKSTLIPKEVASVVKELSSKLSLSQSETDRIAALLQAKAELDADVSVSYQQQLSKANVNHSEMTGAYNQMEAKLAENQRNYEEKISEFLSFEKLEDYRALERERFQQQQQVSNNYMLAELDQVVSNLSENQRQEIRSFLQENTDLNSEYLSLGISGSPYAQRQRNTSAEYGLTMEQKLEMLLSEAQLNEYHRYQMSLRRPR